MWRSPVALAVADVGTHTCAHSGGRSLLLHARRAALEAVSLPRRTYRFVIDPFGKTAYVWGCITSLTDATYTVRLASTTAL